MRRDKAPLQKALCNIFKCRVILFTISKLTFMCFTEVGSGWQSVPPVAVCHGVKAGIYPVAFTSLMNAALMTRPDEGTVSNLIQPLS